MAVVHTLSSIFGETMAEHVARLTDGRLGMPSHATEVTLPAEVNGSRWIVQCPTCNSASYADPADPRFFCIDCGNIAHGGGWCDVAFPADQAAIEAALSARPDPNTRTWLPTEDVADLIAQNVAHGVA